MSLLVPNMDSALCSALNGLNDSVVRSVHDGTLLGEDVHDVDDMYGLEDLDVRRVHDGLDYCEIHGP